MAKKMHEKMFIIPGHKEMQIKTTLRLHFTPVRIATIKNTTTNKYWQGYGGKRNPHTLLVRL
jgi:hypothetical protein